MEPLYHQTLSGRSTRTSKAVQMTQNWGDVFIFGRLIFDPFHILKLRIKHIGFNVGLYGMTPRNDSPVNGNIHPSHRHSMPFPQLRNHQCHTAADLLHLSDTPPTLTPLIYKSRSHRTHMHDQTYHISNIDSTHKRIATTGKAPPLRNRKANTQHNVSSNGVAPPPCHQHQQQLYV